MNTINYRNEYLIFLREKIDYKYFRQLNQVKVLGANFIKNHYVIVFESVNDSGKLENFLLIENSAQSKLIINLKVFNNGKGYIASRQSILKKNLPLKIYDYFVANGIFESLKTEASNNDSPFGIHRLVLSLYDNCTGQKVHHINTRRRENYISNLVKMTKYYHKKIHRLPKKTGISESIKMQNKLKIKLIKSKKYSKTDTLIDEILKWRIRNECKRY